MEGSPDQKMEGAPRRKSSTQKQQSVLVSAEESYLLDQLQRVVSV